MGLDNIQKGAIIGGIAVVAFVAIWLSLDYAIWGPGGVDSYREHGQMCDNWYDSIQDQKAVYEGKLDSLGGALNLGGEISTMRNQLNLDVDRYNSECVGEETHFFEDNL